MRIQLTDEEMKFLSRLLRPEIYYTEEIYNKLIDIPPNYLSEDTVKHLTDDSLAKTILVKLHGLSEYNEADVIEYEEIDLWNSPGWLKPIDFKKLDCVVNKGFNVEIVCKNGDIHRISGIDANDLAIPFLLDTEYDSWEEMFFVDKLRLPKGIDIYRDLLEDVNPNCKFTITEIFRGIKDNTLDVQVLLDEDKYKYVTLLGGYVEDLTFELLLKDNPFTLISEVRGYKINGVDFNVKDIEIL